MPKRRIHSPTREFRKHRLQAGGHCYWCHRKLSPETATTDHYVPKSRGGLDCFSNFVLACADCNSRKGSRRIEEMDLPYYAEMELAVANLEKFGLPLHSDYKRLLAALAAYPVGAGFVKEFLRRRGIAAGKIVTFRLRA